MGQAPWVICAHYYWWPYLLTLLSPFPGEWLWKMIWGANRVICMGFVDQTQAGLQGLPQAYCFPPTCSMGFPDKGFRCWWRMLCQESCRLLPVTRGIVGSSTSSASCGSAGGEGDGASSQTGAVAMASRLTAEWVTISRLDPIPWGMHPVPGTGSSVTSPDLPKSLILPWSKELKLLLSMPISTFSKVLLHLPLVCCYCPPGRNGCSLGNGRSCQFKGKGSITFLFLLKEVYKSSHVT